jgi:hypothetical protein
MTRLAAIAERYIVQQASIEAFTATTGDGFISGARGK